MSMYTIYCVAMVSAGAILALGALFAGYKWGVFAALRARSEHLSKWGTYFWAMLPPAALAMAFLCDVALSRLAPQAFFLFATPTLIGACLRYNTWRETAGGR